MIFFTIGIIMLTLGLTAMLLAGLMFLLDCCWNFADTLFKIGVFLTLIPLICAGCFIAFVVMLSLFGFALLL